MTERDAVKHQSPQEDNKTSSPWKAVKPTVEATETMLLLPLRRAVPRLAPLLRSLSSTPPVAAGRQGAHVELTSARHPDLRRGDFARVEDSDLRAFQGMLDQARVVTGEENLEGVELV